MGEVENNWGVWQSGPASDGGWVDDYGPGHPTSRVFACKLASHWNDAARQSRSSWTYEARPITPAAPAVEEKNWGIWFKGFPNPLSDDQKPGWMQKGADRIPIRYTEAEAKNDARAYGAYYEARPLAYECPAEPETLPGDPVVARSAELAAAAITKEREEFMRAAGQASRNYVQGIKQLVSDGADPMYAVDREMKELAKELFITDAPVREFAAERAESVSRSRADLKGHSFKPYQALLAALERAWELGARDHAPESMWYKAAVDRATRIVALREQARKKRG